MNDPQPYHHGNLKQALLDASLELIRKVGAEAFTLREVARRAGVSHNAPYRHFRDKDQLLAVVAADGFRRLTESMTKAAAGSAAASPLDRLQCCGRGYVEFALRYPQHFTVMFETPKGFHLDSEAHAAGERAFLTLLGYVEACQLAGSLPAAGAKSLALIAWSMVHGVAKLAIGGQFPFSEADETLQFTELATRALVLGMSNSGTFSNL